MTFNELLETVPHEVKAAIEEIEHKAGTTDADWEFVKAAGELLAEAKAASVVPVEKYEIGINYKNEVTIYMHSRNDAESAFKWLQGCMKDTPPTT